MKKQFQYTPIPPFSWGMPFVNVSLSHGDRTLQLSGLIDSGASINLLPYDYGLKLGFIWEEQHLPLMIGGLLQGSEAYVIPVQTQVDEFPPVKLVFAWTQKTSDEVRVLLGQQNFFKEFNTYFYGHQNVFEIEPKQK